MRHLLVACPYWDGDRIQMERMVSLAADLLPAPSPTIDLLFVGRFDARYPSPECCAKASAKLHSARYWRCNRPGTGFPQGCNEVAYGLFRFLLDERCVNGSYLDIDAVLIMEADCVFTRPTWPQELSALWDDATANHKLIAGAVQPPGKWGHDVGEHVNAVALYHPEILCELPCLAGGQPDIGWDYLHRGETLPHTLNTPLIKLDWKRANISETDLYADPALIYHGVKDDGAVNAVRSRFNLLREYPL